MLVRRDFARRHALVSRKEVEIACGANPAECAPPEHGAEPTSHGEAAVEPATRYVVRVFAVLDRGELGDELACTTCDAVDGRFTFTLAGQTQYRVMVGLREVAGLAPVAGEPIEDLAVSPVGGRFTITGDARLYQGCTRRVELPFGGAAHCFERSTFVDYRALTRVELGTDGPVESAVLAEASAVAGAQSVPALRYASSLELPN